MRLTCVLAISGLQQSVHARGSGDRARRVLSHPHQRPQQGTSALWTSCITVPA